MQSVSQESVELSSSLKKSLEGVARDPLGGTPIHSPPAKAQRVQDEVEMEEALGGGAGSVADTASVEGGLVRFFLSLCLFGDHLGTWEARWIQEGPLGHPKAPSKETWGPQRSPDKILKSHFDQPPIAHSSDGPCLRGGGYVPPTYCQTVTLPTLN